MINILKKLKLQNLLLSLKEIIIRFPISLLFIIIVSFLLFYITYNDFDYYSFELDIYIKLIITGILSFFLATGIHLLKEKYNSSLLIYIIVLNYIIVFLYYFGSIYNFNPEMSLYIIINFIGIISFLFISPFIFNSNKNFDKYHIFFYNFVYGFFLAVIIGILLFLLGSIGLSSLFLLFDIEFFNHDNLFIYWAIISFSIISPLYWLTKVPKSKMVNDLVLNENIFFNFLIKFIALPFIIIYFLILYSYSIKVLLNFGNWPHGEVTWLVIGFTFFGYLIYIFSYSLENKYLFIKKFRKLFPFFVVPQIIMLFYAIYLRINQYDITINRYLVVSFGVWLFIISLYFIISKNKYLRIIPYSLLLILVFISIGPWSVYYAPEYRQIQRLEANLIKANILQNGMIYPLNDYSDISEELSKDIYGGIEYICNYGDCMYIRDILFAEQLQDLINKNVDEWYEINDVVVDYRGLSNYQIINEVTKQIKVKKYFTNNIKKESKYLSLNLDNKLKHFPLEVKDYEIILNLYGVDDEEQNTFVKHEALYFILNHDTEILYLKSYTNIVFEKSIQGLFDDLQNKVLKEGKESVQKEDLVFEMQYNNDNIKIFFNEISIKNPNYTLENGSTYNYINTEGFVLTSGK